MAASNLPSSAYTPHVSSPEDQAKPCLELVCVLRGCRGPKELVLCTGLPPFVGRAVTRLLTQTITFLL